jgi:asparagine N-glycosylation enzyme membrane subunit Stt3
MKLTAKNLMPHVVDALLAALSLLFVSFHWNSPSLLTLALLAIAATMILSGTRRAHDALFFLIAGIWGALSEAVAVNFGGAWYYPSPFQFGIPLWLPILWGIAGIFLVRLSDTVAEVIPGQKKGRKAAKRSR